MIKFKNIGKEYYYNLFQAGKSKNSFWFYFSVLTPQPVCVECDCGEENEKEIEGIIFLGFSFQGKSKHIYPDKAERIFHNYRICIFIFGWDFEIKNLPNPGKFFIPAPEKEPQKENMRCGLFGYQASEKKEEL